MLIDFSLLRIKTFYRLKRKVCSEKFMVFIYMQKGQIIYKINYICIFLSEIRLLGFVFLPQ